MKKIVFSILFSLIIFSCNKESDSIFYGITERDPSGILTGNVDPDDWQLDDVWNDIEDQLFNPLNFKSANTKYLKTDPFPPVDGINGSVIMAYPNPASSTFIFELNSNADSTQFVLVNYNYDIIIARKQGGNCTVSINTSDQSIFKKNSIYRVYYRLEYVDGRIERGHGDIKIIN